PVIMILGVYFAKLMTRKIGGITGDTLGAVLELSSVITLFLMYVM
ncbi:MAG: adenosylcobinamide-GDP ribazoletransferase, partial [Cetobacterium sp.]